uniref:26S proteasome non-ATPase regulatory subunit 2 n=3 Tax=Dendroctonus ponderosae TaxID=77166 RepID=A0AAR5QB63_DENPD
MLEISLFRTFNVDWNRYHRNFGGMVMEEDKELQRELKLLVEKITGTDPNLIPPALKMLKYLIRTSTTSMTSVPKPLKYLSPYYAQLKETHKHMPKGFTKRVLADVISVLAMGTCGGEEARNQRECLKYCLMGTAKNIGDWGHEYISQLEAEIVQQWGMFHCGLVDKMMMPLIVDVIDFNCHHNGEIQACDLLMEIDQLALLPKFISQTTYQRMCFYLFSCAKYVDDADRQTIMKVVYGQYLKFGEYSKALVVAILLSNEQLVKDVFSKCSDKVIRYQLAFICARHLFPLELDENIDIYLQLNHVLGNGWLNFYFLALGRELGVMEAKLPEDVYKIWLEPVPRRFTAILGENLDSARQNLASSFVNGFVNAGFGCDKLLSSKTGNDWIYRNKDHAKLSATASYGLIYLWDVDGGLTPLDKYLYANDLFITSGALLALGIVNCRVRNDCDPALALLGEYLNSSDEIVSIGAMLGLGIAYAGSQRSDVISHILPIFSSSKTPQILAISSIACGLITLGKKGTEVPSTILNAMIELNSQNPDTMKSIYMRLMGLGVALCYFGARNDIDVPLLASESFPEPFKSAMETMLYMCSYAGTGNVLIIQELLATLGEKVEMSENGELIETLRKPKEGTNKAKKPDWDWTMSQAIAALGVATVSFGEDIGMEMVQRIFGHMGRYGEPSIRKAVPLAIALSSVSNPHLPVLDVLTKYSHDYDSEVACNSIFGIGLIGAGTNNARLAAGLRQLAVYHTRNPSQLFMVRIAQGMVHMGKGTVTLNPLHTDRTLLDPVGMAGLLITAFSLLEPHELILRKSHYLLYCLSLSIQPRWLLTIDENLDVVSTTVRVGQAVDVIGKAGTPKTIAGFHTHTTPVLLATTDRAELATDQFAQFSPTLDGICILKKTT